MLTLESTLSRVRQILDDADGVRFSDDLLENALFLALARLDEKAPRVVTLDVDVETTSRDQTLSDLENPLCLVEVQLLPSSADENSEIHAKYTFILEGETALLHYSGSRYPQAGEVLRVTYAGQNSLSGLKEATATSLPDSAELALESAAAAYACLLRAAAMAEAYGARPGESTRLIEQSRSWMDISDTAIQQLHSHAQHAFPPGFKLDGWDSRGGIP